MTCCGCASAGWKQPSASWPSAARRCWGCAAATRCWARPWQTLRGLGLLPTQTTFTAEKRRTQSQATVTAAPFAGAHLTGYEIHTGRTTVQGAPFCTLADGTPEGCVQGQVFGTYLHGLFDSGELTEQFAAYLCRRKGIDPAAAAPISMQEYRTQQLDLLADGVRHNLDLAAVYAAMGLAQPAERGNDQ